MNRTMLKSRTHRSTITASDLRCVRSIAIDPDLLADEQVHVVDTPLTR